VVRRGDLAWLFERLFACSLGWLFAIKRGAARLIPQPVGDCGDSILPTSPHLFEARWIELSGAYARMARRRLREASCDRARAWR